MKYIDPLKASSIDSFPALFYQHYWHIVGSEVSAYCLAVLQGDVAVEEINKTHIVLIPKVNNPKSITHFRPISLCNVIYKIIAKIIVNRMSSLLDCCIHEAQCFYSKSAYFG